MNVHRLATVLIPVLLRMCELGFFEAEPKIIKLREDD